MRDDLDFHVRAFWQRGHLDGGAGRKISREKFRVNLVHRGEIGEAREEHRAFDDVGEGQVLVVQDGLEVEQHALGLGLDVARDEVAGGGVQRNLAGAKKQIADTHGVVVRADGRGGFRGFDDEFGGHVFDVWRLSADEV